MSALPETAASTIGQRRRARVDTGAILVVVAAIAAAAWTVMWLTHGGHAVPSGGLSPAAVPASPVLGHAGHGGLTPGLDGATAVLVGAAPRIAGWTVMVVAMMLPPAVPLLRVVRETSRRRRGSWAMVTMGGVGFVVVWIAAGLLFIAGGMSLEALASQGSWVTASAPLLAGGAAIAAGVYQFTPAKRACLTACRSPRSIAMTSWHGRRPYAESARIGARFGLVCVGCCWALMLLTFTVGVAAMPVMVVMAAVMALERVLPRVRAFVPAVAVAAIALGIAVLAGLVPAGLIAGGHS